MAKFLVTIVVILLSGLPEAKPILPILVNTAESASSTTLGVFETGKLFTTYFGVASNDPTGYGHMDMLNDDLPGIAGVTAGLLCKNGNGPKDPMRRTVGGIIVAFLKAYFAGESRDYVTILQEPSVAPVKLDPVQFKGVLKHAQA